MFKNISRAFWFSFVPMNLLAAAAIFLLFTGIIPLYYLWVTLIMWILVDGLGIAVGYHRVFSHKTHELPRWKENIILFLSVFAGQGSSIYWVAIHRGYHHPHADTPRDLHSPKVHGIWHAFAGWFKEMTENNPIVNPKYAVDLMRKSNHVFFHKFQQQILWGVSLLILLIDWKLAFTGIFLVTAISLLQDNLLNLLGHLKLGTGYRNFNTNDNSHNHFLLAFLSWGQGWHNNHHNSPGSYDFGKGVSGKWWEFDISKIFLPLLGNHQSRSN
jgi:stearoyl-CoA desaturase (delta-9 desaturase)